MQRKRTLQRKRHDAARTRNHSLPPTHDAATGDDDHLPRWVPSHHQVRGFTDCVCKVLPTFDLSHIRSGESRRTPRAALTTPTERGEDEKCPLDLGIRG